MFEPENDLERSLLRAVNDPAHRPDFLLRMFNAQTYVALEIEGPQPPVRPDGRVAVPAGAKLTFQTIRVGQLEHLQFFTSVSRARAKANARSVFAPMVSRELFERHLGWHFMLNPGHEHAQTFSADDINRMLAGQFGNPAAAAVVPQPAAAVATRPAPEANPVVENNPPPAQAFVLKAPEPKPTTPEISEPEAPEVSEPKPAAVPPPAPQPSQIFNPQPEARPPAPSSPTPPAAQKLSDGDSFVFNPAVARKPEAAKPAEKAVTPNPEASAAAVASKPVESKSDALQASDSEKTDTLKTAMVAALSALKRLAANTQATSKPQQDDAACAKPIASAALPVVAKPARPEPLSAEMPPAPETIAASQPVQPEPAQPVASAPPASAKAVDAAPAQAPAKRADAAPPEPQSPPARRKPRIAPAPPGSTIGKADPYPVDVLLVLTMLARDVPAIEAAHLAQVQFPGRPPHHLVALETSEDWEPLVQALGLKLQKALPPDRRVEFTPLVDGMFDDYFRNETQPFFKRR